MKISPPRARILGQMTRIRGWPGTIRRGFVGGWLTRNGLAHPVRERRGLILYQPQANGGGVYIVALEQPTAC